MTPRAEPLVSVPDPSELTASEPEEAAPPEEIALVPRQRLLTSSGFPLLWVDESGLPPQEQGDWPIRVPLRAQLDGASLESLQVAISHYPVMGKVQCENQS